MNDETPISQQGAAPTEVVHWLQHWPLAAVFLGCSLVAFAFFLLLFASDAGFSVTWPKNRAYLYGVMGAICMYRGYLKLPK